MRRNDEELAKMRKAGKVVAEMHEATRAAARPGVTTAELDAVARDGARTPWGAGPTSWATTTFRP